MSSVQFEEDLQYKKMIQMQVRATGFKWGIIPLLIRYNIVQTEQQARKTLTIIALITLAAAGIVTYYLLIQPAVRTKAADPSQMFIKNPPIKIR